MHRGTVLGDANKKPVPKKQSCDALSTSLFSSPTLEWRIVRNNQNCTTKTTMRDSIRHSCFQETNNFFSANQER